MGLAWTGEPVPGLADTHRETPAGRTTEGSPEVYWRLTEGTTATLDPMTTRRAVQGQPPARDPLMTVEQAGEYLGTGVRFIRRLITERRITYVKVGKYVRLQRSALDALVDAGRVHSQR